RPGFCGDEGHRHSGGHCSLLSYLLAAATRKGSGSGRAAGGHHDRVVDRSRQVHLHPGTAVAQFSRRVWTVRGVGDASLFGIREWTARAGRMVSVGGGTRRPRTGAARNGRGKPLRPTRLNQSPAAAVTRSGAAGSWLRPVKRIAVDISCEGFSTN